MSWLAELWADEDGQWAIVLFTIAAMVLGWIAWDWLTKLWRERRTPRCAICQRPHGDQVSTVYGAICRHCTSMLGRWQQGKRPVSPGLASKYRFDGEGWRNG